MEASMPYDIVVKTFRENFDELLGHPVLSDLPSDITIDEIRSLISLEHGQAITIKVKKFDGKSYNVIVDQNATVIDLKHAIRRNFELQKQREGTLQEVNISWKYIWKAYWLSSDGTKLKDNEKLLKDYGITNLDTVNFIKRLKEK